MTTLQYPIIGISTCTKEIHGGLFQAAYEKYIAAITEHTSAVPVLITEVGSATRAERLTALLGALDGVLLTGGPTCVNPKQYQQAQRSECKPDDTRDGFVLDLVRAAVAQDVPTLGVCLGFQEINVAMGGTLFQDLHQEGRFLDHRSNGSSDVAERYRPSHSVSLEPGGALERLLPSGFDPRNVPVNSLHRQGLDRLGARVRVEARTEDGLVEAIRVEGASFVFGVQWHLEWMLDEPSVNRALLESFMSEVERRAKKKHRASDTPTPLTPGLPDS